MYNPYEFPRLSRRGRRSSIGARGAGGRSQLQGAQPAPQRSGGGSMQQGMKRTIQRPQAEQQQASSPLGGLLAAKGAYGGVQDAHAGGKNIAAKAKSFGGELYNSAEDGVTGLTDFFNNTNTLNNAGADQLLRTPDIMGQLGGDTASRLGLNGGNVGGINGLDTIMDPSVGFGESKPIQEALTGLKPETVGGAKAAAASPLGAAAGGLGVGLNINDMVSNGVGFGNVTGAIGSGILGASALGIGAANAWNPVGWALLGASAADSIFDIF